MRTITLGPEGTFSERAALLYKPKSLPVLKNSIEEVFDSLEGADLCILPIENNLSGTVEETLYYIRSGKYQVVDTICLPIHHVLIGHGDLEDAEVIYAHPHTYHQCLQTLKKLGISCPVISTKSNGETIQILEEKKNSKILGIVPLHVSEKTRVPVIERDLEDRSDNATRFVVLKKTSFL